MLKDLATRKAVDKTAALVTSPGVEIAEPEYPRPHHETPPPSDSAGPLKGKAYGHFTVVGYMKTHPTNKSKILLVRCVCGRYEERSKRNLRVAEQRKTNPKCQRCNWHVELKRKGRKA